MNHPCAALGVVLALAAAATAQPKPGDPAIEIEFKDSLKPSVQSFKDLRGKVLMLDFFATW